MNWLMAPWFSILHSTEWARHLQIGRHFVVKETVDSTLVLKYGNHNRVSHLIFQLLTRARDQVLSSTETSIMDQYRL